MLGVTCPGWAELGSKAWGLDVSFLYRSVCIFESSIEIVRSKKLQEFSSLLCWGGSNLMVGWNELIKLKKASNWLVKLVNY